MTERDIELEKWMEDLGYQSSPHGTYYQKVDTDGFVSGLMEDVVGVEAAAQFLSLINTYVNEALISELETYNEAQKVGALHRSSLDFRIAELKSLTNKEEV